VSQEHVLVEQLPVVRGDNHDGLAKGTALVELRE
jgi:hypothetical protein